MGENMPIEGVFTKLPEVLIEYDEEVYLHEAHPLYHFLIYNWGNYITKVSKREIQKAFKNIDDAKWLS